MAIATTRPVARVLPMDQTEGTPGALQPPVVLLVERCPDAAARLRRAIASAGFTAFYVRSGAEARALLEEDFRFFTAMLLPLELAAFDCGGDGSTVVDAVSQRELHPAIVAHTNRARVDEARLRASTSALLRRPMNLIELCDSLRAAVEQTHARRRAWSADPIAEEAAAPDRQLSLGLEVPTLDKFFPDSHAVLASMEATIRVAYDVDEAQAAVLRAGLRGLLRKQSGEVSHVKAVRAHLKAQSGCSFSALPLLVGKAIDKLHLEHERRRRGRG